MEVRSRLKIYGVCIMKSWKDDYSSAWVKWRINICKKTIYGWIAVIFSFEEDFIKKMLH